MRHQTHKHTFSRRNGARKALLKGLVNSLVEHGRIRTTLAKAKELRRHVEKAVTLGKKGDVATRRVLTAKFSNSGTADKLVSDISVRMKDRPGGYTRIIKAGLRPGDKAPMALIEFVDYELPESAKDGETTVRADGPTPEQQRAWNKRRELKKKNIRNMREESRKRNRK